MLLVLLLLGLIFGSFVNAFVWRLHNKKNFITGRSECVNCHHQLAGKDLVPVFSWLLLKGRCRYCQKQISWQYPVVELITGLLFMASYQWWPWCLESGLGKFILGFWLIILVFLVALVVYDLRWMLLPDKIVFPLIWLAVIYRVLLAVEQNSPAILQDGVWGLVLAFGFFGSLFYVSKGKWIGGGDVKFSIFLGLLLGLSKSLLAIMLAFNLGALVVLPLLMARLITKKQPIPFGPFLIAGTIISQLFGNQIIDWYTSTVLLG
jgi:prepilin signal peptidase PulO-like enzyme (type II secretory pathway)